MFLSSKEKNLERYGEYMNDAYIEYMIKRNNTFAGLAARIASVLLVVICVMLYPILNIIAFGISVIAAYLVRYTFQTTSVEFEYIYFAGECRIDKIMAKRKRKSCMKVELERVEIIAPEGSEALKSYENKDCITKKFVSGTEEGKKYIIYERKDSDLIKIIFEPNEAILKAMQAHSPRKVIL